MLKTFFARLFVSVLLAVTGASWGAGLGISNEAALARSTLLPTLGETRPAGAALDWRLSAEFASEYAEKGAGSEQIILDGETHAYSLRLAKAFGERWSGFVHIPVLHTGGGFLDSHIDGWHEIFGLPQGGRDEVPHDSFRYAYSVGGQTVFDLRDGDTGLGDVQLGVGRAIGSNTLLRLAVDLPTGDEDQLTGGSLGMAMWVDQTIAFDPASRWRGYVSAGLSVNETVGPLQDLQRAVVPLAGAGLSLRLWSQLELVTNLYLHGPLYEDNELAPLERPGLPLGVALRWCLASGSCLQLGFQEDLSVSASPDFTLRLAFSRR